MKLDAHVVFFYFYLYKLYGIFLTDFIKKCYYLASYEMQNILTSTCSAAIKSQVANSMKHMYVDVCHENNHYGRIKIKL